VTVHFYYGDKLKAVDVLDEDGESCDGGLKMDEIVTMGMRSSENRPFIIVQRANGKQFSWEKKRFVLHERAPKGFANGVTFNGGLPVITRT
jgi:hypothetical protein